MATKKIDVNLDFYNTGDKFCVEVSGDEAIKNSDDTNSGKIAQNVIATITLSAGLDFDTGVSDVSQGTLTEGTGIWSIGSILPCKEVTASICVEITDDSEGPFTIDVDTVSDTCDCTLENTDLEYTISGVSCEEIKDCNLENTHGNYADDVAAAAGSVPVGGVYFNTTTSKLHTRMT